MRVKMLRHARGAMDRQTVQLFMRGRVYETPSEMPQDVADAFLSCGYAEKTEEYVGDVGPAQAAPHPDPVAVEAKAMAAAPENKDLGHAPDNKVRERKRPGGTK